MNRLIEKITKVFSYISAVIFAIIVVLVLSNIIGRTVFNSPIKGTVEVVQYGVMFCAGIVMCRSGLEERHISVTFLIDKYPKRIRAILIAFGKLLGTVVFGILGVIYITKISEAAQAGKLTDTFRLPFEYIYAIMAICFVTSALIFLYQFIVVLLAVGKKTPEIPGGEEADKIL